MMLLLFATVMVATVNAGGECPPVCTCRSYPRDLDEPGVYYTSLTCGSELNVTRDLPDSTETLAFVNASVDLDNLMDDLCNVQDLPYFSRLILRDLALPNICNVSISGLDRLRSFKISNCKVECVPRFNLSSLQILDFSNNELTVIQNYQFRTLSILVLNLSANAINTIEPNGFSTLNKLKCLDLSKNNLTVLQDNVLVPLQTLQHLNLSNNKLQVLDEACFSGLLYLQQLDLSWNRLARVAPGSLQLPSLARLLLAGNPQLGGSREPALFVGTGRRLQTVDASRTGLKQVPSALTHSIRTLRLAGNSIPSVSCGDLDSYPLLQLLDFTSNQLGEIEEDALGRLDSLTILYLTDNRLRSIPHSLPERLRVLHLENNKVEAIQTTDLQGLIQLEVLLLSGNRIKVVNEAAFSQLTSLTTLDLSHNPITILPTGSLTGPTELRVLRLAGLNVISPAKEVEFPLPSPEHLITLDLSNSPGLARQMLADTAALAAARELQELNVATSGLNYIRSDLLHFLPQLRALRLRDNPLNCSNLEWLAEWMRKQDSPEYREVVCASPPELWGTLLVDLQGIEPETTESTINHTDRKENNGTYAPAAARSGDNRTATPMSDDEVSTIPTLQIISTNKTVNKITHKKLQNEVLKEAEVELYPKKLTTDPAARHEAIYSGESHKTLAHPGMLILATGLLCAAAVLIMLTTRITRRRRHQQEHEDIEVSSLPSVTELW